MLDARSNFLESTLGDATTASKTTALCFRARVVGECLGLTAGTRWKTQGPTVSVSGHKKAHGECRAFRRLGFKRLPGMQQVPWSLR